MDTPRGLITPHVVRQTPGGKQRDDNDWRAFRWNRDQHEGFMAHRMFQSTPMFFSSEGHSLWLGDTYRGRTAFLVASGPSFHEVVPDPSVLKQPGVITMGLNNSPKMVRPNLWTCVDSPSHFMKSIWLDPTIQKFVPLDHADKQLLDNDSGPATNFERWSWLEARVRDCPNVAYYRRNEHFQAQQYLWEDTFNWGNHKDLGGGRSVFLVAIRLLYVLGFRRVFLLGVDLDMSPERKYGFEQDRSPGSIKGNNSTYEMLQERFTALRPIFEQEGFHVYNCNPKSKLTAFDYVPFNEALEDTLREFGLGTKIDIANENTKGLYDREDKEKKKREAEMRQGAEAAAPRAAAAAEALPEIRQVVNLDPSRYGPQDRAEVKSRLDAARAVLEQAKADVSAHNTTKPNMASPEFARWEQEYIDLKAIEEGARIQFRTVEDEKRYKHGEPTRWGLWEPE